MKRCPNCRERLKGDAILCTHCGHQFAPIRAVAKDGARPTPDIRKLGCAVVIIATLALLLWALTSRYQAQSPEAANAVGLSGNGPNL